MTTSLYEPLVMVGPQRAGHRIMHRPRGIRRHRARWRFGGVVVGDDEVGLPGWPDLVEMSSAGRVTALIVSQARCPDTAVLAVIAGTTVTEV